MGSGTVGYEVVTGEVYGVGGNFCTCFDDGDDNSTAEVSMGSFGWNVSLGLTIYKGNYIIFHERTNARLHAIMNCRSTTAGFYVSM